MLLASGADRDSGPRFRLTSRTAFSCTCRTPSGSRRASWPCDRMTLTCSTSSGRAAGCSRSIAGPSKAGRWRLSPRGVERSRSWSASASATPAIVKPPCCPASIDTRSLLCRGRADACSRRRDGWRRRRRNPAARDRSVGARRDRNRRRVRQRSTGAGGARSCRVLRKTSGRQIVNGHSRAATAQPRRIVTRRRWPGTPEEGEPFSRSGSGSAARSLWYCVRAAASPPWRRAAESSRRSESARTSIDRSPTR